MSALEESWIGDPILSWFWKAWKMPRLLTDGELATTSRSIEGIRWQNVTATLPAFVEPSFERYPWGVYRNASEFLLDILFAINDEVQRRLAREIQARYASEADRDEATRLLRKNSARMVEEWIASHQLSDDLPPTPWKSVIFRPNQKAETAVRT